MVLHLRGTNISKHTRTHAHAHAHAHAHVYTHTHARTHAQHRMIRRKIDLSHSFVDVCELSWPACVVQELAMVKAVVLWRVILLMVVVVVVVVVVS